MTAICKFFKYVEHHIFAPVHKADTKELQFVGQMRFAVLLINLLFNVFL